MLSSDITINSLTLNSNDATLQQTAGTLHLVDGGANITAGDYVLTGGTFASDDPGTISSRFDWNGGTIAGLGALQVLPGATLSVSTGNSQMLSQELDNAGVMNFTSGLTTLSNGTINNQSGGVLNISGAANFTGSFETNYLIRNSGTISFDSNGGTTNFTMPLLNSGTIQASNGSLVFGNGIFNHNTGDVITGTGFVERKLEHRSKRQRHAHPRRQQHQLQQRHAHGHRKHQRQRQFQLERRPDSQ